MPSCSATERNRVPGLVVSDCGDHRHRPTGPGSCDSLIQALATWVFGEM